MSGEIALHFKDITFGFGKFPLFENFSLSFYSRKIYAVLGPDGAGKTTFLRLAVGVYTPWKGEIRLMGENARKREKVVGHFGYLPQKFSLYGDLTVEENLYFYGYSFNLKRETLEKRVKDLSSRVGLSEFRKMYAKNLSGGMKKKLGVICNLLYEPEILLLNEPTTGIDPLSRAEIWEFLLSLVAEKNTTLIFTTPYMEEAERADEVIFLFKGKVQAKGNLDKLKKTIPVQVFQITGPSEILNEIALEIPREWTQWMGNTLRLTLPQGERVHIPHGMDVKIVEPNLEDFFLTKLWKS